MIYTLTLSPSLDYYISGGKIENTLVNKFNSFEFKPGGKGINISILLNNLNYDTICLGFVGGFVGSTLQKMLNDLKIKTDFIEVLETTRINIKVLDDDTAINLNGPNLSSLDIIKLNDKLKRILKDDLLIISGSIPSSVDIDLLLKDVNCKLYVDTSGDKLLELLKYKPFLIKPNHLEASQILNMPINNLDEAIIASKKLQALGACNVVLSMGDMGSILLTSEKNIYYQEPLKIKVISTVGCGDSLMAGMIKGLNENMSLKKAYKVGCACATLRALKGDTPNVLDITNILNKINIIKIN